VGPARHLCHKVTPPRGPGIYVNLPVGSHVLVTERPGCVTTPPLATPGRFTFTRCGVSAIFACVNRQARERVD
jgi:hypothetical protein